MAEKLYGRDAALMLARDFLTRDERDGALHSRQYPVVVITGPRGIGKTALLNCLGKPGGYLDQRVPYAYVDCEQFDGGVRDLLSSLAFQLNRRCSGYGPLPFPRLVTGQIAIAAKLDTDPDLARRQMGQALENASRPLAKVFFKALGQVLATVGEERGLPPDMVATLRDLAGDFGPPLVLSAVVRSRRGRRLVLGRGQDWYGHQDRDLGRSSLDELVDLSRSAKDTGSGGNRTVAELLWAAFLADLTDSFRRSRQAIDRTLNCVILLDNADAAIGRMFLNELVTARRQRMAYAPADPDPATVVVTSRGGLTELLQARGVSVAGLADAGYSHYQRERGSRTHASTWWYPVALPELTRDDIANWAAALGLRPDATEAVFRFSGGHPCSAQAVLEALDAPSQPDLPALLNGLAPGIHAGEHGTVGGTLLARLTASAPAPADGDLVTCSAARHKRAALRMATDSGLLKQLDGEDSVIFAAEFWRADGANSEVMHPALRRLLLMRLGARGHGSGTSWQRVNEWLRISSRDSGDETGELYHALALGDVKHVSRSMAVLLGSVPDGAWIGRLRAVAAAPNRLDHRRQPDEQVRTLTKWAEPEGPRVEAVARLVVASWLCSDPLNFAQRARLRSLMNTSLRQVLPFCRLWPDDGEGDDDNA